MHKDHYRTLGVIDSAELAVIKAAYKALMQIYHPDRYTDPTERSKAEQKAKEINEAYRVLSDPKLRAAYDRQRASYQNDYEPEPENAQEQRQKDDVLETNWDIARQFVDDLDDLYNRLTTLSPELGFTFKLVLLETKRFNDATPIALELKNGYLLKYFGKNREIQLFGEWLISNGKRPIALELNKTINVMGSEFDAERIIEKIVAKHQLNYVSKAKQRRQQEEAKHKDEERIKNLRQKNPRYYECPYCDFKGNAKIESDFNWLTFLVLLTVFVIPGIIYLIGIYIQDKKAICPSCNQVLSDQHIG